VRMHTLNVIFYFLRGWTHKSGGGAGRQVWTSSYIVRFIRGLGVVAM